MIRPISSAASLAAVQAQTQAETPAHGAPLEEGRLSGATTAERLAGARPAHTPEWTDFNGSDPGVTVLQALAWPLDAALYRNVVPAAHRTIDPAREGTTTQDDIDQGRLVGKVGMAPLRPAEFVIVRFSHKMGGDDDD